MESDDAQRLSKHVAALAACSRREAEQYITDGWVRVDGQRVELPQARVQPGQRVEIDPAARLQSPTPATYVLHKPAGMEPDALPGLLQAARRWSGDASGIRPVRTHQAGLRPLLPLPAPASGLVVLSQDGRVIRKLTEDAGLIEQELLAEVRGEIAPDGLRRLGAGLPTDSGRPLPPARVSWQSERRLRVAAKGIAPEWLPWMCAQVGLELVALKRLRIGRVPLAGLPPGEWRYLAGQERF